jgi:hypothetical protein
VGPNGVSLLASRGRPAPNPSFRAGSPTEPIRHHDHLLRIPSLIGHRGARGQLRSGLRSIVAAQLGCRLKLRSKHSKSGPLRQQETVRCDAAGSHTARRVAGSVARDVLSKPEPRRRFLSHRNNHEDESCSNLTLLHDERSVACHRDQVSGRHVYGSTDEAVARPCRLTPPNRPRCRSYPEAGCKLRAYPRQRSAGSRDNACARSSLRP